MASGWQATVGNATLDGRQKTLNAELLLMERSRASFTLWDPGCTQHFSDGQRVTITDKKTGLTLFGGMVVTDQETLDVNGAASQGGGITNANGQPVLIHNVTCSDYHGIAARLPVAKTYQNQRVDQIVLDLYNTYLQPEGISLGTIDTGSTTFGSVVFAYAYLSDVLDALANKSGMVWNIDETGAFSFIKPGSLAPAWNPTGSDMEDGTVVVTNGNNTLYRNGQYILGGQEETSTQTETRKGDGVTQTFPVAYPLSRVPTITVNGVTKTVGIRGVDTGKDWYWQQNDNTLSQDSGAAPLANTDTWQIQYIGLFPTMTYSEDPGEVATRQSVEGGGTGKVQNVYQDASLTTTSDAFDTAAGLLQTYAQAGRQLVFQSRRSGLKVGMLCNVTLPWHGFNATPMLVTSVKPIERPAEFWWQYTLVEGPVIGSWVTIFLRLAANILAHVDTLNLGSSQTLALLQPVSESWNWTESVVPTVYACPLFPMTFPITLC